MTLPTGPAVTFLFTDIEGSTRLEQSVGSDTWARVVARHDALLREAIEGSDGVVVKTEGDAFFAAFADPGAAIRAAVAAQRALASGAWPDGAPVRCWRRLRRVASRPRRLQRPNKRLPKQYKSVLQGQG